MPRPEVQKGTQHIFCLAYVTSIHILLVKASDVAEPKIQGQEVCHTHLRPRQH